MGFFDLFRPMWKHSNPDIRLEAVRHITEEDTLQKIIHADEDVRVRRAALKKVENISFLEGVAQKDADIGLRSIAQERASILAAERILQAPDLQEALQLLSTYSSPVTLLNVLQKSSQFEIQTAVLERLHDEKDLVAAVQQLTSSALRKQALERIENPSSLRELGLSLQHKELAGLLVSKINDPKLLIELCEKGTKAVRQAAQSKRAHQSASEVTPLPLSAEKARDKKQKLCRLVESISLSSDWDEAAEQLQAAQQEWERLDASSETSEDSPLQIRFTQALEQFRIRRQAALAYLRETAKQEELQRKRKQSKESKKTPISPESSQPLAKEEPNPQEAPPLSEQKDLRAVYKEHQKQLQLITQGLLTQLDQITRKQVEQRIETCQEVMQNLEALPAMWQRPVREELRVAREALRKRLHEIREAQDWKMWSTQSSLEQLCIRIEALQQETDMQSVMQQFPVIATQWRNLRTVRMEKAEALKDRFRKTYELLLERVSAYKQQQRQQQIENIPKKEALCKEAEALADSTDWAATDTKLRLLQTQWKEFGLLPKEQARVLQERFRKACNHFYNRRKAHLQEQKALYGQRIQQKEILCAKAEAAAESTDWRNTNALLRSLMNEWKNIEPIPRAKNQALWERFRRAFDLFYQRRETYFEHQKEEAQQNLKQKQFICEQLSLLLDTTPMIANTAYEKLQGWRNEWRDIGPIPKEHTQQWEKKFLQLCERFLQRFRSQLSETQRQELTKALSRFENRIVLPLSLQTTNAHGDFPLEIDSLPN